jgi:NAD-dependent dihydropyrimidine dehydrogenase PreA subunit
MKGGSKMCEFCTKHGEGKKWYLQIKNYADELLFEELSATEEEIAGVTTRVEWLNDLFENYIMPAMSSVSKEPDESESAPSSTELPEVLPSEEETVAARQVEHFGQVLPIEDVEEVIDIASSITRMACGCRFVSTGKKDERYHFGLMVDRRGTLGKFPDAASSLEVLEKEEAKSIFRKYDEEGLMHLVWTAVTPYVMCLCNCDRDCQNYKAYIENRGAPRFFRGEYVSRVDWDLCTGCKSCMAQCQFGAQFYSATLAKVYIDPTRCFGCGVCRAACPDGAITLLPRQEVPEAAAVWLK